MNALYVLDSIGIKINDEAWKTCKNTLDVNKFAYIVCMRPKLKNGILAINKGYRELFSIGEEFGIKNIDNRNYNINIEIKTYERFYNHIKNGLKNKDNEKAFTEIIDAMGSKNDKRRYVCAVSIRWSLYSDQLIMEHFFFST